jgi:flagellar hook protein FlgE
VSQAADPPVATSAVTLDANLPANSAAGATLAPTTIQVYDASGNTHSVTLTWAQTSTGQWTANVSVPDDTSSFNNTLDLGFGTTAGTTTGTIQSIANAAGSTAFTVPTTATAGQPAEASFSVNFGSGPQTIALNLGTFNQSGGVTQYDSADDEVDVSSATQNGLPQGTYEGVNIDSSGNVNINYSNGQSVTAYKIPLVQFNAPNELQSNSNDVYSQTATSGTPNIVSAGTNGAGTIEGSELEDSNVDITDEFTKMIQTQQIYSANSRAITTANDMLSDLLSIIHA